MLELLRLNSTETSAAMRENGIMDIAEMDHDPDMGLTWSYPKRGIELRFARERVVKVTLFGVATGDYRPYQGAPVAGVEWKMSYDEVQAELGPPSVFSEGNPNSEFVPIPPWLRYDSDRHSIHFEFAPDQASLAKVTFTTGTP